MAKVPRLKLVREPKRKPKADPFAFQVVTSANRTALAYKLQNLDGRLVAEVLQNIVAPIAARAGDHICWSPLGRSYAMTVTSPHRDGIVRERGQQPGENLGELLDQLVACGALSAFVTETEYAESAQRAAWIF